MVVEESRKSRSRSGSFRDVALAGKLNVRASDEPSAMRMVVLAISPAGPMDLATSPQPLQPAWITECPETMKIDHERPAPILAHDDMDNLICRSVSPHSYPTAPAKGRCESGHSPDTNLI